MGRRKKREHDHGINGGCIVADGIILTFAGEYRAGDPPPEGYIQWHAWAEAQVAAGIEQHTCCKCCLWKFEQELSPRVIESTAHEIVRGQWVPVKVMSRICLACDAARVSEEGS